MKAKAREVPHEFVPVELSITLHTHQELIALQEFLKLSGHVCVTAVERIPRGVVSIPFFQEFTVQFMNECREQLKDYVNQYDPQGGKK